MDDMTAEQAAEAAKGLTFEKVWAVIIESRKETEESFKRMEKTVADLSKNIGGLGNSLGRFTEAMFEMELWKKFTELGYTFEKQSSHVKYREYGKVIAEIDLFLEDGDYIMLVEVKTELDNNDVNEHLDRIDKVRQYINARNDSRKIVGAVAGGIVSESTRKFAQNNGLFVITQSGESVMVADIPPGFKAREW